jgi:hypothetical protein
MRVICTDRRAAFASDPRHVVTVGADRGAAFTSNESHVVPVSAHLHPTFATGDASLLGCELVGPTLAVSSSAPFARYLALPLLVHRAETSLAFF